MSLAPQAARAPDCSPLVGYRSLSDVAAYRRGAPVSAGRLLGDVARAAAALPGAGHMLNLCSDRYRFAVAFLAALARGHATLLPPVATPNLVRAMRVFAPDAYCVCDEEGGEVDMPSVVLPFDAPSTGEAPVPVIAASQSRPSSSPPARRASRSRTPSAGARWSEAYARRALASASPARAMRSSARCRRSTCTASNRRCSCPCSAAPRSPPSAPSFPPRSTRRFVLSHPSARSSPRPSTCVTGSTAARRRASSESCRRRRRFPRTSRETPRRAPAPRSWRSTAAPRRDSSRRAGRRSRQTGKPTTTCACAPRARRSWLPAGTSRFPRRSWT